MAGISVLCRIVATSWNLAVLWFHRGRAGGSFFVVVRSAVTVCAPTIQRRNLANWWTVYCLTVACGRWRDDGPYFGSGRRSRILRRYPLHRLP